MMTNPHKPAQSLPFPADGRRHANDRKPRSGKAAASKRTPRPVGANDKPAPDGAIQHWIGTFHGYHTGNAPCTPVALRMDAATESRLVYEVALRREASGEKWLLICWEVDVPGIRFCDCVDRAEALTLFAEPQGAASRWQTVRLRPEFRPW